MFTGLIADVGTVTAADRDADGARLRVETALADELAAGDSIAVAGVCLTATEADGGRSFGVEVANRTLELTTLGAAEPGAPINLELALRAGDRLGGHLVQGHVDGLGTIAGIREDGFARWVEVELPPELRRYAVDRGSIALDGVSLTVARLTERGVEVSLIPETLARTTFGAVAVGEAVNVEVDQLARYAERLLQGFKERESE